jgi:dTDP-4-dehydrorhamnose 3,5-epimerase
MLFEETPLSGAYLIQLERIEDHRGFFARGFCREEFERRGLNGNMTQLNIGCSPLAGTLRGLHYQNDPHAEAKLIRCTRGRIFDVIVDLRADSGTRGRFFTAELTAADGNMLYAPEGFAHGYQTLMSDTEMYYLTSASYAPAAASGLRYDDAALGIRWPLPVTAVSDADLRWPGYQA